jgi:hypothetical protein
MGLPARLATLSTLPRKSVAMRAASNTRGRPRLHATPLRALPSLPVRPLTNSPATVKDYLRLQSGPKPYWVFMCLFLDARHHDPRREKLARPADADSRLSARNRPEGARAPRGQNDRRA